MYCEEAVTSVDLLEKDQVCEQCEVWKQMQLLLCLVSEVCVFTSEFFFFFWIMLLSQIQ